MHFCPVEEFDDLGRLQRTCNGDVAVNKCEGQCTSQVQPSVVTPTGFLKVREILYNFLLVFFYLAEVTDFHILIICVSGFYRNATAVVRLSCASVR